LNFRSGWPRIHETQAAFVTFDDCEKILRKETPVGHSVDGSVAGGTAQITGDDFHGARLYIIAFKSVHFAARGARAAFR
jgi:hypothetical protein